jgi:hypothetical protein
VKIENLERRFKNYLKEYEDDRAFLVVYMHRDANKFYDVVKSCELKELERLDSSRLRFNTNKEGIIKMFKAWYEEIKGKNYVVRYKKKGIHVMFSVDYEKGKYELFSIYATVRKFSEL